MAHHHVLILGGHGKVAQLLTPMLLQRSWTVTSLIRSPDQVPTVESLGEGQEGKLSVLVRSIEDVKSEEQAGDILKEVGADLVVWSAGAGGKGGAERTYAIDRDAAIHFINASAASGFVTRFLNISYLASRRNRPTWFTDEDQAAAERTNTALADYYQAKIVADETLYRVSRARGAGFVGINLRPGTLTDQPESGVSFGKINIAAEPASVPRATVARVAELLLAKQGVRNTWLDLQGGTEGAAEAVARVVSEGVDSAEEEPVWQEGGK